MTSRSATAAALTLIAICGCAADPDAPSPVLFAFGRTGIGPCEFSYPRAAAIGADGGLFIVDKLGRVQCFSRRGEFVREWRMPAIAAGKPTGLGVGPDGRVYAADTHYASVKVYLPDGTPDGQFGEWGMGPGQFMLPTDVAVGRDGRIYVGEYAGNDRISVFSPQREYLFSFPPRDGPDALSRPQSLTLDSEGTLWVADACNHRVCRFSPEGRPLGSFGTLGEGPGQFRFPYNVEPLSDGTLVVVEYGNNRVQRVDRTGKSLGIWGRAGRLAGELAYPWALVVDAEDLVYVVDSGNNRVEVFDGRAGASWKRVTSAE